MEFTCPNRYGSKCCYCWSLLPLLLLQLLVVMLIVNHPATRYLFDPHEKTQAVITAANNTVSKIKVSSQ